MTDAHKEFWDRLDDVQAGMLGLTSDGEIVPMSPSLREADDGKIWFITAEGTDLVTKLTAGPAEGRFVVADSSSGLYSNITGTLALENDRDVLDEIWSPVASAWFEDDKADADLRLVSMTPARAATWFSTTSGIKFLYEIAKANISGSKPDTGWQADITF